MTIPQTTILPVATGRRSGARLWQQVRAYPRLGVLAVLSTAAASVASVAAPLVLGRLVDVVIQGGTTRQVVLVVVALVLAAAAAGLLLGLARRWCDQLGVTLAADLREDVLDHALQLDAETLELAGSGDVASRITDDVEKINASVDIAARLFVAIVTVVTTAVGFATLDWRLALAFCAVFPVHWFGLRFFLPAAARLYATERRAAAGRAEVVLSVLGGAETVRAYGMADRQVDTVRRASREALRASMAAIWAFAKFGSLMNIAEAVGLSSLLVTGFFLVQDGTVTVGDVTAAALLFHRLFGPLGVLFFSFNEIQQAGAALARLVGVVDLVTPPRQPERVVRRPLRLSGTGLTHRYQGGGEVLHTVDVDVPAGISLAVVGESGAGKTTLAALLGGVFPAGAGRVRLGDDAIETLDPVQVRQRVAVVSQEVHLFAGTLAEDLRLARPGAGVDELWTALRTVGAHDWVAALPNQLDTEVGPGGQPLTADQAQQVALARIVLIDPPVVILDEATAEAGSAGARSLERSARAVIAGRTALVVAHRLTQARECDRILVMAHGRVVELGTHDELLEAGGTYATLWSAWRA